MEYAICRVPAAPVRKDPAHRSEMVNQLLFGETMLVMEEKDEWLRIVSTLDSYEGWVTFHMVEPAGSELAGKPARFVASGLVNKIEGGEFPIHIPLGSSLPGFNEISKELWKPEFRFHGTYEDTSIVFPDKIIPKAKSWMYAPYLWGGKTFMGTDCSGFVQTVFRTCGFLLKRDAWQQEEQGTKVELGEAKEGDVAFFHNQHGRVIHVGIIISPAEIIHASGRVRTDRLDSKGIFNKELGKYTHELHSVKRMTGSGE
jgi:hypothetical protein